MSKKRASLSRSVRGFAWVESMFFLPFIYPPPPSPLCPHQHIPRPPPSPPLPYSSIHPPLIYLTLPTHPFTTLTTLTHTSPPSSFAYVEMSLILAKTLFKYDLELVNNPGSTSSTGSDSDSKGSDSGSVVDWEGASRMHIMWWKPELRVRFLER